MIVTILVVLYLMSKWLGKPQQSKEIECPEGEVMRIFKGKQACFKPSPRPDRPPRPTCPEGQEASMGMMQQWRCLPIGWQAFMD